MPFDPGGWAEDRLEGARKRGASIEADCPFCGKEGHLYVHRERGYFTCFAKDCGRSGRGIAPLIAQVEGVSLAEARRMMFRDAVQFHAKKTGPSEIGARLRALVGHDGPGEVDVPPPPGMVPVWDGKVWRLPEYLAQRGITRRLARRFGLGYCGPGLCAQAPAGCQFPERGRTCSETGRCRYSNRIVLPFACPNGRSFTTRAVDPEAELRYLNPPSPKGRLFYGWQNVVEGGELVVVEGPFDVLRMAAHGLGAVAVMGLTLGGPQMCLLGQARLASVTVMLDAGVETEALALAGQLIAAVGAVYVARLPGNIDPGETTREQAWAAFRGAEPYRASRSARAASLGRRLGRLIRKFTSDGGGARVSPLRRGE